MSTPVGHILDDDTIMLWRMDSDAGSLLVNETGRMQPTISSGGVTDGLIDGAMWNLQAAEYSAYLDYLFAADSENGGVFTIETWVRLETPGMPMAGGGSLFSHAGYDAVGSFIHINLEIRTSYVKFGWSTDDDGYLEGQASVSIPEGEWHHVALRRSGSTVAVFVDGALAQSFTGYPPNSRWITSYAATYLGTFFGLVDDTRISSVARSDAEILESYKRGAGLLDSGDTGGTVPVGAQPTQPSAGRGGMALRWNAASGSADISVVANDIGGDSGLETAIMLSLFLDRRAEDGDVLPDGATDRRGWWADEFAPVEGDKIGSRLWLLSRAKPVRETALRAEEYAREALAWLVEDRVATRIEVSAEIGELSSGARGLFLGGAIYRPGKTDPLRFRYDGVWKSMEE